MTTIKGPITVKKGEIGKLLAENDIKVKLPFTANKWKSDKIPENVDISEIITEKPKVKEEKEKKEVKSNPAYTEKELYKMTKNEQIKLLKEAGLKTSEIPTTEKERVKLILKLFK